MVWETYSLATPFEFALVAGVFAWCVQQEYRGWPARILRHPALTGLIIGLVFWPVLYFSFFTYSDTLGLPGWDYVASLVRAVSPIFIGQAALAGVLVEGVRSFWPRRLGRLPPPYVSSLNRKLLFTLIPLFSLGIALLFWADITIATRVSTTLVIDQMERAAQNAGRGVPFFIQTGSSLIQDLAARDDLLTGDSLSETAHLSQSLRSLPFFRQLTLFDATLKPVAGYPVGGEGNFGLTGDETGLVQLAFQGIPQDSTVYSRAPDAAVDVLFI